MLKKEIDYNAIGDSELIERLTATPADERLHDFFFNHKCKNFLSYIATSIYHCNDGSRLMGELYEFLSDNDWALLKNWKAKNGASLYSYIAYCSINYFIKKSNAEKKRREFEILPDDEELLDRIANIIEDEVETPPVWKAYNMLSERDKLILHLLVIEEKNTIDAAPQIWKFINSSDKLEEKNRKRIQSTISMAKNRAQLALVEKLREASKEEDYQN